MPGALAFDTLIEGFHQALGQLPDCRTGQNITYSIKEAALGAFSVFFTQCPSFLAHQRMMRQAKGRSNAESLFGLENIPCDNQIRQLLDPIAPSHLFPIFRSVFDALNAAGQLDTFRTFDDNLLFARWYPVFLIPENPLPELLSQDSEKRRHHILPQRHYAGYRCPRQ